MNETTKTEPKGIGGWLLLPLSGLILGSALSLGEVIQPVGHVLATCHVHCDGSTVIRIGIVLLLVLADLAFVCWLFSLSYRRSKRFIKWMRIVLLVPVVLGVLGGLVEYLVMTYGGRVKGAPHAEIWLMPALNALIWIPYFKWSRRVKNTFTQP